MASAQTKARFIEPMLLLRTDRLPEGDAWEYELKLEPSRSNLAAASIFGRATTRISAASTRAL